MAAIAVSPAPVRPLMTPALALPVASFTFGAATVAYLASGRVGGGDLAVVVLASCLVWPAAAAVLLDRHPGHALGPVLCMPALVPLVGALAAGRRGDSRPLPSDVLEAGPLPVALLVYVVFVALPLQVSSLGHPSRPGRRRSGSWWTALAVSVLTAVVAAAPGGVGFAVRTPGPSIGNPGVLVVVALVAAALGAHVMVALAWRRSAAAGRDLLGWYLIGSAVLGPAAVALALVVADGAPALVLYALAALIAAAPAALTLLLLSPSPPALDLALARAAAFVVALVALVAVYLAAVAGLAATGLPDGPVGAAVLTGTAALVAVPAWGRCRSWVEDLLFGSGRRPETVLRDMRRGLGDAHPAGPLTAVTDWVAAALRSPGAKVHTDAIRPVTPQLGGVVVPLRVGGADVGCLELAPRASGERYGRRDLELVEQLAVPVALVAQAVATGQALARSRQQVTDERARERRRVLDDLHDGLGPSLAGVGLHLSAARRRLAGTPDLGARGTEGLALLDDAVDAVQEARTVLRQLVLDLGPDAVPATEHRGLAGSVAELVEGWAVAGREIGLGVHLEVCEVPESLPAEVQLAAYRIVGEAVTNVVRHARASRCTVRVFSRADPDGRVHLVVRVADDGCGVADKPFTGPGVGLRSMRGRAQELGGRLELEGAPAGGMVLAASLPLTSSR